MAAARPGLGLGLPLTLVVTALAGHYVAGLGWAQSLLIGAILSPSDPVFASALVGNEKVPAPLRHLLNVESGVNDGLALPSSSSFSRWPSAPTVCTPGVLAWEIALGLVLGVLIPVAAILLERSRFFSASAAASSTCAAADGRAHATLSPRATSTPQ
jgi:sodium/hydrogen antiporter